MTRNEAKHKRAKDLFERCVAVAATIIALDPRALVYLRGFTPRLNGEPAQLPRPSAAVLHLFERRRDNMLLKECLRITTELKSKHSYPATMPAAPNVSDYESMKKLLRDLETEDEKTRAERLKAQAEQLAKLMVK